tara:strand:- start:270 stop:1610 length:1341 start_codon:yes stop_codon:yes gene_type:complete
MKNKDKDFNFVANIRHGGKSTIELFNGLDHEGDIANAFIQEFKYLETVSSEIEIKINSSGGSVMSGLNVVSTVLDSNIPTTARIVGIAASMASVIALAADKTIIADYALFMVHNPFSPTGDAQDAQLLAFAGMLKKIYSNRLGLDESGVEEFMNGEEGQDGTWFNAEKALEVGFVSEIEDTGKQKSLEESLSEFEEHMVSEDIANELQTIAASFMEKPLEIEDNKKNIDTENGTAEVVISNDESVPNNLNNNFMSLDKISASLKIEDATIEAIDAKVNEIVANNTSLEKAVADKNAELVEANSKISDAEVKVATVSAELETAVTEKETVEAKVEGLEAKIAEFEADAKKAHAEKITLMVNEAADAGKINNEAKETWVGLLEASFETASVALEGLVSANAGKVKLSEKVSNSVEEVKKEVKEPVKEVVAELPTIEGLMSKIGKNPKK